MDHELAVQTHAVERYVIGEMPAEERDAFEEHYADCRVCLTGVHGAAVFAENARAVFQDREQARYARPAAPARNWLAWLTPQAAIPAFAALALACVVGYQNTVVIPGLRAPQSITAAVILDPETRSALPQLRVGEPLAFRVPLDHLAPGQSSEEDQLAVKLTDVAENTVREGLVKAPGLKRALDVYFPGKLNPGRYSLVVRMTRSGLPGSELARNQFEIVSQESTRK